MVVGWRRAFGTSVSRDRESKEVKEGENSNSNSNPSPSPSPRFGSKFGFFSNPSTPRLQSQPVLNPGLRCRTVTTADSPTASAPESPKLQSKTKNSPRFFHRSNPSSPRSPSTFSLLKSSLRLHRSRCGICLHSLKTGQGTAIFTAECSHGFHFPCIAAHLKAAQQPRVPYLKDKKKEPADVTAKNERKQSARPDLKVYNDDEPLMSPKSVTRFNPIPELDENEGEEENGAEEFQGFFAALISLGRGYETYAVVLKVRAPPTPAKNVRRVPIDLVTVLDVGDAMTADKVQMLRRAMRLVVWSLSDADRLSIVAFAAGSKRLLPLRRMTATGRLSARRIIDALVSSQGTSSASDALKKAAKVLEDRRERNPAASILLLSEGPDSHSSTTAKQRRQPCVVSTTRFAHLDIPVHSIGFSHVDAFGQTPEDPFAKFISGLLSVVVQDLRLQLTFPSGSPPAEIAAVYSCSGSPAALGSGSSRIGNLYAEEERELLIELKVPSSTTRAHHVLSVRCCHNDPSTQDLIYGKEQLLLVPRLHAVRSSTPSIERLRGQFLTTRAVAESRLLLERNHHTAAIHMLSSARALLIQSKSASADEFIRCLDAELAELQRRRTAEREGVVPTWVDDKGEPLTPTSAWRAAERLAKVAIVRRSMNRVSDLNGFENARF
ncbi:zinc finger (C3HC4-type RING finger) family protein [Actinidia rufa]|uniref:Zinc finger (C3HC4-type RING finger) family protein n=1 Tax=Actinidia rufa TaxID=165716 RepID=A0A7J0EMB5_9ERIC|nr:zinc finger (C3HC4-type RING finger) family protein [Actinidia rufa]